MRLATLVASDARRKFNCCRQVMDILEKHDYKLKKTFNHTDEDKRNIKVRTNHTFNELANVLQEFGAKVDVDMVKDAFQVRQSATSHDFAISSLILTRTLHSNPRTKKKSRSRNSRPLRLTLSTPAATTDTRTSLTLRLPKGARSGGALARETMASTMVSFPTT